MRTRFAASVALAALLPVCAVQAQETRTVRLIPRVGLLAPDAYFYEQFANFSGDGPVEWSTGSLGRALVLGLGLELGLADGAVRVRGEILRSFDTWLRVSHSVVTPRVLYIPPSVRTTWLDVPSSLTVTSLQLVLPTRIRIRGAEPYVLGGVGGKFYGFDEPTTANEEEAILPSGGFTWGGDVGAGFTVPVKGLVFDFQVRDEMSRFWDKLQHDFVYSSALIWSIR